MLTVQNSISAPANENASRYERFMDPPPVNRYYRLVDKDLERVINAHFVIMVINNFCLYRRVDQTQGTLM